MKPVTRQDVAVAIDNAMDRLGRAYTIERTELSTRTKWVVSRADMPLGAVVLTRETGLAPAGWLRFESLSDEHRREWGRIVHEIQEQIEFETLTGDYWGKVREHFAQASDKSTTAYGSEAQAEAGQPATQSPKWLPKTAKKREKWREAYKIICEEREQWRDPDDWGNDTTLKLAEYGDALRDRMGWRPSEKTISRIIRAGDAGWLR